MPQCGLTRVSPRNVNSGSNVSVYEMSMVRRGACRLVNDILDAASFNRNRLVVKHAECDLPEIAQGVCDLVRPLVGAKVTPSIRASKEKDRQTGREGRREGVEEEKERRRGRERGQGPFSLALPPSLHVWIAPCV